MSVLDRLQESGLKDAAAVGVLLGLAAYAVGGWVAVAAVAAVVLLGLLLLRFTSLRQRVTRWYLLR